MSEARPASSRTGGQRDHEREQSDGEHVHPQGHVQNVQRARRHA